MSKSQNKTDSPSSGFRGDAFSQARKRLRLIIAGFLLGLVLPLYFLLETATGQLEKEAFFQLRANAEELTNQIEQRLAELLIAEDKRGFIHYSFIKVKESNLVKDRVIEFSPLSEFPTSSSMPGLIGYFQVDPDGVFSSPIVPKEEERSLLADIGLLNISSEELAKRRSQKDKLRKILAANPQLIALSASSERKKTALDGLILEENKHRKAEESGLAAYQLSQLNIDSRLWSQKAEEREASNALANRRRSSFSKAFQEQRREQAAVPAPQKKSKFDYQPEASTGLGDAFLDQAVEEEESDLKLVREKEQSTLARLPKTKPGLEVLTLEGEVDPFQMKLLETGEIAFFRRVWRNNKRYIQGFLCNGKEFLSNIIQRTFENSPLSPISSLVVGYQGKVLYRFAPQSGSYQSFVGKSLSPGGKRESLLYRSFLLSPFDSLEFVFTAESLPDPPGAWLVKCLGVCISLVLIIGLGGIYRLGMKHIALASERSNFVSAVSHELKTPLTSIRMYSEMLRSGWVEDKQKTKSYYDYIFFESERLSRLISNVLHLSRLGSDRSPLALKDHTPKQLLELIRSKVSSQIEAVGFEIGFSEDSDSARELVVRVEEDAFTRVFINLVDNALKFSAKAERKRIELGYRVSSGSPGEVVFFVRDYGPGVERTQMKKIFQLFYRAESEMTRTTPGTGIGLALVSELVNKMGASIDLRNKQPGAEFQVRFVTVHAVFTKFCRIS